DRGGHARHAHAGLGPGAARGRRRRVEARRLPPLCVGVPGEVASGRGGSNMSQAELDRLIEKIQKEFSTWTHGISVPGMRESWDRLFTDLRDLAPVKKQVVSAGGVPAEWLDGLGARADRAVLYLHRGRYVPGRRDSPRDPIPP